MYLPPITLPPIPYSAFKKRMIRNTLLWSVMVTAVLAMVHPAWVVLFAKGSVLGVLYLLTLLFTSEHPSKAISAPFSILRVICVSFLIVYLGGFKLLESCVVFSGCLGYKVVLTAEIIGYSIEYGRSRVVRKSANAVLGGQAGDIPSEI